MVPINSHNTKMLKDTDFCDGDNNEICPEIAYRDHECIGRHRTCEWIFLGDKFAVRFEFFCDTVPDRLAVALIKSQLSLNMVSLCHFNVMTHTSMSLSGTLWLMFCRVRR